MKLIGRFWFLQLDDWVLCRIYNKKGTIEKQQYQSGSNRKTSCLEEPVDKKPVILTQGRNAIPPPAATTSVTPVPTGMNDYIYFDTSESIPRLHTDSSCSEHVVSPEFTCEVQSEPKWKEWEKALDFPFNYGDAMIDNGFGSQFQGSNQMSPLQDMFMYLPKPFWIRTGRSGFVLERVSGKWWGFWECGSAKFVC